MYQTMNFVRFGMPTLLLMAATALMAPSTLFAETETGQFIAPGGLSELLGQAPTTTQIAVKGRFILDETKTKGYLLVSADIALGWHVYSTTQPKGIGAPLATKIIVADSPDYQVIGPFSAKPKPNVKTLEYVSVPIEEHSGNVVWSAPIALAAGADPSQVVIRGEVDGQICEDEGVCMQLSAMDTTFEASYDVSGIAPTVGATSDNSTAAANVVTPVVASDLLKYICYGFVGGLLLNLMPCVLPVIGLKIMSFASQAGESRSRVITLNLTYVAGIVSVFVALAALAAFLGWGWGDQFQRPEFGIVLASIVFVFGLSFLGVWEIPIPGFVGSGSALEKSEGEGVLAAFLKGVLTTLLATPCGGPLIAPTLTWALAQSRPVIFGTFISMGLGMGAPYLAISFFPRLINFLPKPGAWMDTFKQVMGFVLLGTVVWIFSFLPEEYFVPTLALLVVLWAACWWINRTPITADLAHRAKAYLGAAVFAGLVGYSAFNVFLPDVHWPAYSDETLASMRDEGTTVLVDFTADY